MKSSSHSTIIQLLIYFIQKMEVKHGKQEGDEDNRGLPNLPVRSILQNPIVLSEVIVGTESMVYKKLFDSSPTWNSAFNGMSDVRVTDLDMRDDYKVLHQLMVEEFPSYFSSDGPLLQLSVPEPSLKINQGETGSFSVKLRVFLIMILKLPSQLKDYRLILN